MTSMTRPTSNRAAKALGWLSIGLGAAELAGAGRMLGLIGGRRSGIARLYGLREVATGIGLLTAANPVPWVWGRVGGDVLDAGSLLGRLRPGAPRKGNRALALVAVALIGALDVGCARGMRRRG
jgi:hypothetical protein